MGETTARVLISRLADWGVDTVFGLPGDGINGIMEGLRRNGDKVRFVLVHHEEAAPFMATAHAKTTTRRASPAASACSAPSRART
ncbi:thiamine pyrophosphate-binding protein [Dactylosporangium sp. AC04546]|uniref:thiamine pyrophosphate-binding protein n=1 Tax=Dactylosporangium sp. AC04546 TaxID=2862460 RepID=UPI001EDECDFB|nr:thiamine pyrophosphate-binding protein [Dactylosporangium sp. AC04546]WVK78782.1 thiamine pyrophosphate-binding protein [Dactylosporangium sp. AC04546]